MTKRQTEVGRHPNAKAVQRVADAWAMRVRGATWDEVARALGYANAGNACRAVSNYVGTLPTPEVDHLRSMWRERLETLWPIAVGDAQRGRHGSLRAAVAIADRASKLDGLDAPRKLEITPGEGEIDRIAEEIARRSGYQEIEEPDVIDLEILDDNDNDNDNGDEFD